MLRLVISIVLFSCVVSVHAQELSNSKISSSAFVSDNASFLVGDVILHKDSGILNSFSVQLFSEIIDNVDAVSISDLIVYPNPSSEKISVISDEKINSILITDVSGKVIKNIEDIRNHQDINVSELQSGLYILVINDRESVKLSINK